MPLAASGFSALTRDVAGHLATVGRLDAADLTVDPSQAPSAASRDLSSADEAAAWKAALSVDATAAPGGVRPPGAARGGRHVQPVAGHRGCRGPARRRRLRGHASAGPPPPLTAVPAPAVAWPCGRSGPCGRWPRGRPGPCDRTAPGRDVPVVAGPAVAPPEQPRTRPLGASAARARRPRVTAARSDSTPASRAVGDGSRSARPARGPAPVILRIGPARRARGTGAPKGGSAPWSGRCGRCRRAPSGRARRARPPRRRRVPART